MTDVPPALSDRGSQWHRWDPHLHAPGTLLNDQFKGDWARYLECLNLSSPPIRALGVTDYFCISTYQAVRRRHRDGELPGVLLLFPNVEIRLDIKTERRSPINLHLLFSPDDENHESEIQRILGQLHFEFGGSTYCCTLDEFERLGRAVDPRQTDRNGAIKKGANQFKVNLTELRKLFRREKWLRENCLVGVAGGLGDGTSGLQKDDSWEATRRELESFADIIFSATPSQRDFWLGKNPKFDPKFIEQTYGFLKPCLHGSDAHAPGDAGVPAQQRYCWLRGDLVFETLRQAVLEPEDRVWIGEAAPPGTSLPFRLDKVTVSNAPWIRNDAIELNGGLVTIIGTRGSGKTALADIIARGADAMSAAPGESSFLRRATHPQNLVGTARVELTWGDGSTDTADLQPPRQEPDPLGASARYLSQQFVEQLCSSSGLATELRREIERVIFNATSDETRLGATTFDELRDTQLDVLRRRRDELRAFVAAKGDAIVKEEALRDGLITQRKTRDDLQAKIKAARIELGQLLPKGKEDRAKRLSDLEQRCADGNAAVQNLRLKRQRLQELKLEAKHVLEHVEPQRLADMQETFSSAGLSETEWNAFRMVFAGDVDGIVDTAVASIDATITKIFHGDPTRALDESVVPMDQWPLTLLRARRDELRKDVGSDATKQKKFEQVTLSVNQNEAKLRGLDAEIEHAAGADARRRGLIEKRREHYVAIFEGPVKEQEALEDLYGPLRDRLAGAAGALSNLEFFVHRRVDVDRWAEAGKQLLDLRTAGRFRGQDALRDIAEAELVPAWRDGTAEVVATAMEAFRNAYHKDLRDGLPQSIETADERRTWVQSVAAWLYSTNHITLEYGVRYDGARIEQLSPGMRGIVLLLLYLAIDDEDRRPLIIDQPEENLDPKSVFDELVVHFRAAKKRRQVIMVTHNANLVVNTDADQVIVAESIRPAHGGLPIITYRSGSLENRRIRDAVCETLEGGKRAFLERAKKYGLSREDAAVPQSESDSTETAGAGTMSQEP